MERARRKVVFDVDIMVEIPISRGIKSTKNHRCGEMSDKNNTIR